MAVLTVGDGALLIIPSQRVCGQIIPWRREYDPEHWRMIPPHVTLAYPFVRRDEWPEVRRALAERLARFSPFWVTLAELGAFENPGRVLWLRPDDGGAIRSIHATVTEYLRARIDVPAEPETLPFVPHMTLGFFDSAEGMAAARERVAAAWEPLRFRVRALRFATYSAHRVWRMEDAVPLGGADHSRTR